MKFAIFIPFTNIKKIQEIGRSFMHKPVKVEKIDKTYLHARDSSLCF